MRVVEETNRPDPSAIRIERFVSSDQALASKVLRVVNSAYYGVSGQVSNLGQAVMILGLQQMRNLVLSMGAIAVFEVHVPKQRDTLKRFWLHSFSTASLATHISHVRKLDKANHDHMLIAGLLHDVGKLFLYANFTSAYDQLVERALASSISIEMAELTMLGIGHGEVGQLMGEFWRLPDSLSELIGAHEGPFQGTESPAVYCVHIADALTKHLYYSRGTEICAAIDPYAMSWLDMTDAEFEALKEDASAKTADATAMCQQMAA
jgi:HD-like signal output (HDOD) protein